MNKEFERVFPKDNLFFVYLYAISAMLFFFQLSWQNLLIGLLIDGLAFAVMAPASQLFFYKILPEYRKLKSYLENDRFERLNSLDEQIIFFNLLAKYPESRAIFVFFVSMIKVMPVGVFLAYVTDNNLSFLQNLTLFYVIDVIVLFYCSSLVFIQLHTMGSELMKRLSTVDKWIENYPRLSLELSSSRFSSYQNLSLFLMLITLCGVFLSSRVIDIDENIYSFTIMCVSAIFSIGVILLKFQAFTEDSLKGMFQLFENSIQSTKKVIVPLHTSPLLAGFEYSFNQLGYKLEQREKEIANWLKRESEQFHLKALGEITALVAHDIKTPLHVMQMSLEVINDPAASDVEKEKYAQILEKNLNQTISFTQSLMAHLKGVKDSNDCRFGDVHQHLIDILSTQFSSKNFHLIDFDISDELSNLSIGINRLDAMHVFYNIYHNAIRAVLDSDNEEKRIKLWTEENGAIYLYDNGPGLSKEDFNQFISYERFGEKESFNRSLGLRLTHTLVKRLGGDLDLIPVSEGTCYKIVLPLAESSVTNWNQIRQGQTAPENVISQL